MLNTESSLSSKEDGLNEEGSGGKFKKWRVVEKSYGIFISCKTYRRNIKERYLAQLDNSVPIEVGSCTEFPMPDVGNLHGREGPYRPHNTLQALVNPLTCQQELENKTQWHRPQL